MIRAGGTPQALSTGSSPTFAGLTLTGPLLAPDGTVAAPSYSFANSTNTGLWRRTSTVVTVSAGGSDQWEFQSGSFLLGSNTGVAWGNAATISGGSLIDTILTRDAANTLAQRNGTNAQTFRLYNTYTDVSNYERGFTDWNANIFRVGTSSSGTGAARQMQVGTFGNNSLQIVTNAIGIWQFQASGHLLALTDNSYDIGSSGANRPRNIYAGTSVVVNGGSVPYAIGKSAVAVSAPADTTEDTLATINVPANAMGANGRLRITTTWSMTNNANVKTAAIRFSGGAGSRYLDAGLSSNVTAKFVTDIFNRGATNSQAGSNASGTLGLSAFTNITSAVDTTAATTIVITGQKAVAGDTITLESYLVEVIPN